VNDHVFISYSRTDSAYLKRLTEELKRRGIHYWVDDCIDYGAVWEKELRDKAETCAVLVVVMTPDAEQSEWVPREVRWAESKNRGIMPLLLDGNPLSRLAGYQHGTLVGAGCPPTNGSIV